MQRGGGTHQHPVLNRMPDMLEIGVGSAGPVTGSVEPVGKLAPCLSTAGIGGNDAAQRRDIVDG
ncbi:MAG TPA: hypothetical protein VH375_02860 [Rhodanobacteraceae bacterium]